ncbi:MAG: hypothetical protein K9L17_14090 [Clostridiales bacterium]|nr:hypothetical protein [Clostridiales bacterium]MCF8023800.1 hypothetical protein [Clostridiales bacterium]
MLKNILRKFSIYHFLSLVSIINALLLIYTGWDKYKSYECPVCHMVPFLPISDVALAIIGAISAVFLSVLCYLSQKNTVIKYFTLFIAFCCAGFSSFLIAGQLIQFHDICYQCLHASIGFYLIFVILAYTLIIKPLSQKAF